MPRTRYTMKDAEARLKAINERDRDTLELHAAYGGYKVVRIVNASGGHRDIARPGRSGYQPTPRAALEACGLSLA
jgi:hypothetical protein